MASIHVHPRLADDYEKLLNVAQSAGLVAFIRKGRVVLDKPKVNDNAKAYARIWGAAK